MFFAVSRLSVSIQSMFFDHRCPTMAGNLKKSMLTGMLAASYQWRQLPATSGGSCQLPVAAAASYQWRQLLLLFDVLHEGEGGMMRGH
jgi:hypothetical protein